jgi:hypothetical protein
MRSDEDAWRLAETAIVADGLIRASLYRADKLYSTIGGDSLCNGDKAAQIHAAAHFAC